MTQRVENTVTQAIVRQGSEPEPELQLRTRVVPIRLPVSPNSPSAAAQRKWIVLEAPANLVVPKFLERDGLAGYEPKALACFLAAIGAAHDGAVWDVGANVGVYGMVARALTDRAVRAFEPEPDIAALALRTAVSNGLFHPVETLALGSERGSATFYLSDRGDSSNSLARDFRPSSRSLTVAVETVDEIVARTGEHPAVLKIDTETTESDVLRGAAKTLADHRPWILCEVLSRTRYGRELMEVMGPWGYHWYHIAGEFPLAPAAEIRGDNSDTMWLFTPEPVPPEFWNDAQEWLDRLAECAPNDVMTSLRRTRE